MEDVLGHEISASSIRELEEFLRNLGGDSAVEIAKDSYRAVLQRLVEMSLFSDREMLALAKNPDIYLGSLDSMISKIMLRRTGSHHTKLSATLANMMKSEILSTGGKGNVERHFLDVLRREVSTGAELRCFYCGYHFTNNDVGENRKQKIQEAGLELASSINPRRLRDPWKPTGSNWTALTIDHRLPEASLGSTTIDNLVPSCGFCNSKKQISRRYGEMLAGRASSALLAMIGDDNYGKFATGAALFFRIWRDGHCMADGCAAGPDVTELTAESTNGEVKWTTLLPWDLQTRCYEHVRA